MVWAVCVCEASLLFLTLLRRRSDARVLEDLEVFMAEVVELVVEEGAVDDCLVLSWSPGLGSPALAVPPFNMALCATCSLPRIGKRKTVLHNDVDHTHIQDDPNICVCDTCWLKNYSTANHNDIQ